MRPRSATLRALGVGLLVALLAPAAHATDTIIAGDLDYAKPMDSKVDSGGGFGFRLGKQVQSPGVVFAPELGFTYHAFGGRYAPGVYRGIIGLRLGVGEVFRPGIFGHIGIGHAVADRPGEDLSHTALTFDAGAFFDFTLLPLLNVGVHASYDKLSGEARDGGLGWLILGAHAELVL